MPDIHVLDENTANKIAAGEVVERPASIVKELMENSMDAGADRIVVEADQGGTTRIRISDNGSGMGPEDIPLAFARHATSKIRQAEDLYAVTTMGFRGEALPSIAAVSRVRLTSSVEEDGSGHTYEIHGGQEISFAETPSTRGTRVEVTDLFFNTPARRKFLKAVPTETRAISEVVQRLAVARPDISVELVLDGKTQFRTRGSGDLRDALAYVFPLEITRALKPVEAEPDFFRLEGLVGPAFLYRSSRDLQLFYINGRLVRSPVLTRALEEAYRHMIPVRRYPVGVLKLTVNPAAVDVNIHPSKLEVKFSMEERIAGDLTRAVRQVLESGDSIRTAAPRPVAAPPAIRTKPEPLSSGLDDLKPGSMRFSYRESIPPEAFRAAESQAPAPSTVPGPSPEPPDHQLSIRPQKTETAPETGMVKEEGQETVRHPEFLELENLGMVGNTYLLARGPQGLYIVDQHAAHERLRFEELLQQWPEGKEPASQMLMEPVPLGLTLSLREKLGEEILTLRRHGIVLEYQEPDYFLRGTPAGLSPQETRELLEEVLEASGEPRDTLRERILMRAACRGAVKAGQTLSPREVRALLEKMARALYPYTCPHGRPTVIRLSEKDLEKLFLRI